MSHPASAGAGRDGSRLRELADRMENYEGSIEDRAAIANWAFEISELLAVPDPLASDTGQVATCPNGHGLMRRVADIWECDTCHIQRMWPDPEPIVLPTKAEVEAEGFEAVPVDDPIAPQQRLLAALKAVTEHMDRAGGDGYGTPECPWCQEQFDDNRHTDDCQLVKARELIAEIEGK